MWTPPEPWSHEEMDRLLALWDAGKTAGEIELAMGGRRSRNAILGKVYRLRKGGVRFGERGSPLGGKYWGPTVKDGLTDGGAPVVPTGGEPDSDSGHREGTNPNMPSGI